MSLLDVFSEEELLQIDRTEVFVAIRTDGASGAGSETDPYNGSTDTLLDNLLSDTTRISAGMTIHFGPGMFQTKGFGGSGSLWGPLSRQRYIGSGMFETTLQVVQAIPVGNSSPIFAIGSAVERDGVEIADMTIDANLSRQPLSADAKNDKLTVGGINLSGTNIKISRVRVINWGTYSKDKGGFPIFVPGFGTAIPGGGTRVTCENLVESCMRFPSKRGPFACALIFLAETACGKLEARYFSRPLLRGRMGKAGERVDKESEKNRLQGMGK